MKLILKSFIVFALSISITNCGEKKETDTYGNPFKEKAEVTTETIADPLITKGQELFEGKGTCTACHKPDTKVIGPSIKEITEIYREKGASIVTFLKGESDPIVDSTQYEVMKANLTLTKTFSDEELQSLEKYMYSQMN